MVGQVTTVYREKVKCTSSFEPLREIICVGTYPLTGVNNLSIESFKKRA